MQSQKIRNYAIALFFICAALFVLWMLGSLIWWQTHAVPFVD